MKIKKVLLFSLLYVSVSLFAKDTSLIINEDDKSSQVLSSNKNQSYTYVRCWYRTNVGHDDPATDWEWAKNDDGSYYVVHGYWKDSFSLKNMFYSRERQSDIKERCEKTLNVSHNNVDILYFAADNMMSYNYTIWTNDDEIQQNKINRIVAFGDSLSDTGNMFNSSQWLFPNDNSWFLGHFSNGLVWTEYLAKAKNITLYNIS